MLIYLNSIILVKHLRCTNKSNLYEDSIYIIMYYYIMYKIFKSYL